MGIKIQGRVDDHNAVEELEDESNGKDSLKLPVLPYSFHAFKEMRAGKMIHFQIAELEDEAD